MRIATRFSIGVHILTLLGSEYTSEPTSEWIAGSVGVNPVVIRNISGMLRRAGLVTSSQGKTGTSLARALSQITLLDVYCAVDADGDLFGMHGNPNPDCPVGNNIQSALNGVFVDAQQALEARLQETTLDQIVAKIAASST